MEDAQEFVIESSAWMQIDGTPSSSSSASSSIRSPSSFNIYFSHYFILLFVPFSLVSNDEHLLPIILTLCKCVSR